MNPCQHMTFTAEVNVNRLSEVEGGPVTGFSADIRIQCSDCQRPFSFRGVPLGLYHDKPSVSVDGLELRAPIEAATS